MGQVLHGSASSTAINAVAIAAPTIMQVIATATIVGRKSIASLRAAASPRRTACWRNNGALLRQIPAANTGRS
jgi:hypothetical protein